MGGSTVTAEVVSSPTGRANLWSVEPHLEHGFPPAWFALGFVLRGGDKIDISRHPSVAPSGPTALLESQQARARTTIRAAGLRATSHFQTV